MGSENTDEPHFIGADASTSYQEKTTFKEIALQHYKRVANFQAVEFRGGYWERKSNKQGMMENIYVHNTREVYIGAVNYLYDLLLPYFDEEMIDDTKKLDENLSAYWKVYTESYDKNPEGNEDYLQQYLVNKTNIKRALFQSLSKLLFRLKYLDSRTFEEEE